MKSLILDTLQKSVKELPDLLPYLKGDAALYGVVWSYKTGEAPDDKVRLKDEKELSELLQVFFGEQQERIIKELKKEFGTKSIFDNNFWINEASALWNKVAGKMAEVLNHGLQGALKLIPQSVVNRIGLGKLQSELLRRAMDYRTEWISTINKNTMESIWKSVEAWQKTGDPVTSLVDVLKKMGFSETRAKMIATTETTRLNALAHQIAYKESGVVTKFRWMTANDELVCKICGPNHGQIFPLESLHNLIPAHPNCRCYDEPVIDERHKEQSWGNNPFENY